MRFRILIFLLVNVFSQISMAETLQDCLLGNLKGVSGDTAAKAIIESCEKKYAESDASSTSPVVSDLTDEIVIKMNKPLFSSEAPVYKIPVPKGNWVKVGESSSSREHPPLYIEVWVNAVGSELHNLLFVTYNKSGNEWGWKVSKQCNRTNLHNIVKKENREGGKQNCYGVNHYRISGGSDKIEAVREAKEYARENSIAFPSTLVTHFHRFADRRLLDFWIGYNPELEGFPPPTDASWDSNDWHQDRIIGQQDRLDYIEKIRSLAEETHRVVEPQFK